MIFRMKFRKASIRIHVCCVHIVESFPFSPILSVFNGLISWKIIEIFSLIFEISIQQQIWHVIKANIFKIFCSSTKINDFTQIKKSVTYTKYFLAVKIYVSFFPNILTILLRRFWFLFSEVASNCLNIDLTVNSELFFRDMKVRFFLETLKL